MTTNSERVRAWRAANREKHLAQKKRHREELRSQALAAYGNACACCGETTDRFLTVDHVSNDGNKHRDKIGSGSTALYGWLRTNAYPEGFQTLCQGCNVAKNHNGGVCPHVRPREGSTLLRPERLRKEAVEAYGGSCACCGETNHRFLTVSRDDDRPASSTFYVGLRDRGFPEGHRVECWNCNAGTRWNGGTCPHAG
jgi:hypothetical protein